MIRLAAGESLGTYKIHEFIARGGFALVYLAEDSSGEHVALKVGDVAGGGRYVTRFLDITDDRRPEGISPDETPAEAIFFRKEGARIDFLDAHEIDELVKNGGPHAARRDATPTSSACARPSSIDEGRSVIVSWTTCAARRCARRSARSRASASTGS